MAYQSAEQAGRGCVGSTNGVDSVSQTTPPLALAPKVSLDLDCREVAGEAFGVQVGGAALGAAVGRAEDGGAAQGAVGWAVERAGEGTRASVSEGVEIHIAVGVGVGDGRKVGGRGESLSWKCLSCRKEIRHFARRRCSHVAVMGWRGLEGRRSAHGWKGVSTPGIEGRNYRHSPRC